MAKWDFKRELARKSVHFFSFFILFVYFIASDFFDKKIALIILVFMLIISIEFEFLRVEIPREIPILKHIWKYSRRKKEKNRLGGDVFFLIGAILVLAIFDVRIAMAAILMTTFGDLSASLVGKKFGKNYFMKQRAWEGTLAEFFVDILIGMVVFFWVSGGLMSNLGLWAIILVMALTATIVETIIYKLDDNLLIPVFAGFNGQIVLLILNYFV